VPGGECCNAVGIVESSEPHGIANPASMWRGKSMRERPDGNKHLLAPIWGLRQNCGRRLTNSVATWMPRSIKHVVLGLIFLKYISDAFEERHEWLVREAADPDSEYYVREQEARYEVAEDRDEYTAENIFWVPKEARWSYLKANAK
jgi:HsdM N-terminal domain